MTTNNDDDMMDHTDDSTNLDDERDLREQLGLDNQQEDDDTM